MQLHRMSSPLNALRPLTVAVLLSLLHASARAADAPPSPGSLEKDIRPLLDQYCFSCHNAEKAKSGVNLAKFADVPSIQRDSKLWRGVLEQLNDRAMPPENKPQPSDAERLRLVEWVQHTLTHLDPAAFEKDPGRVTLRRLNRFEYNNTVRDLFDVAVKPADTFPVDAGGGAGFDNNADTLFVPPILLEQYLSAADAVLEDAGTKKLLPVRPDDKVSKRDAAKQTIAGHARRAFRRPVPDAELEPFLKLFDLADQRGDDFEASVKLALKAILVSPHFLFRVEADKTDATDAWEVSDYELATRLSYFLWSTTPDDELLDVAAAGKLRDSAVLEQQVRRMLNDGKSKALGEGFGTQWLGIRELLTTINPDPERFPKFTAALRYSMYDEAVLFVDSVFRDDAPLTTLVDADYAFVNDWLTEHYGIDNRVGGGDAEGELMRRITLPDRNRGGVLSLGAVLTVTSYPLRTSPVLRGKWVLEQILGTPPPPPPPDVPELPKDEKSIAGMSLRKQLEVHRDNPNCASCHNRMDPIGFGLENFDAVGRWRTKIADDDVDSTGVMPGGESFSGPAELKKVLLARKDAFVRNVTEKMLGYALGRGLEYYDQPTVKEITDALAEDGYKSSTLVMGIVKSHPFRYRRNPKPEDTGPLSDKLGVEDEEED